MKKTKALTPRHVFFLASCEAFHSTGIRPEDNRRLGELWRHLDLDPEDVREIAGHAQSLAAKKPRNQDRRGFDSRVVYANALSYALQKGSLLPAETRLLQSIQDPLGISQRRSQKILLKVLERLRKKGIELSPKRPPPAPPRRPAPQPAAPAALPTPRPSPPPRAKGPSPKRSPRPGPGPASSALLPRPAGLSPPPARTLPLRVALPLALVAFFAFGFAGVYLRNYRLGFALGEKRRAQAEALAHVGRHWKTYRESSVDAREKHQFRRGEEILSRALGYGRSLNNPRTRAFVLGLAHLSLAELFLDEGNHLEPSGDRRDADLRWSILSQIRRHADLGLVYLKILGPENTQAREIAQRFRVGYQKFLESAGLTREAQRIEREKNAG